MYASLMETKQPESIVKKITLDIRDCEGAVVGQIPAVQCSEHLAVHRYKSGRWNHWRVTHIPTGTSVAKLSYKEQAFALAAKIAGMADWNFSDRTGPQRWDERQQKAVRDAIAEAIAARRAVA